MTKKLGVAELKRHFSKVLDRVFTRHEHILIRRHGEVVAAIVPTDALDDDHETTGFQGKGLLAAAGAWSDHTDIDGFVDDIIKARRRARDRKVKIGDSK